MKFKVLKRILIGAPDIDTTAHCISMQTRRNLSALRLFTLILYWEHILVHIFAYANKKYEYSTYFIAG